MPSVTSIGSALKESDHEPGEFADAENAEFSHRLGEGSARKAEEPAAAQAGTGSQQGVKRPTLSSLPTELQQEIMGYLTAGDRFGRLVQSYFDLRNTRLTHRSLDEAFLGDRSLKLAYTNAYKDVTPGARKILALRDIDRWDLPADEVMERTEVTADQAIARYDVTNIVDQGIVREAGAARDVETGLLPADAAIRRHKLGNVKRQRRVRHVGAASDVATRNKTISAALQRHGVEDPGAHRALWLVPIKHTWKI